MSTLDQLRESRHREFAHTVRKCTGEAYVNYMRKTAKRLNGNQRKTSNFDFEFYMDNPGRGRKCHKK